jgi:hypothetical protein
MRQRIVNALAPIRKRQAAARLVKWTTYGLLAGSLAAIAVGCVRLAAGVPALSFWGLGLIVAGPIVAALASLLRAVRPNEAALAVDRGYNLKDRTLTAVEFETRTAGSTPVHELQLSDAEEHLQAVDPRHLVPVRASRMLAYAACAGAVALTLLFWPRQNLQAGPAGPLDEVLAAADDAKDSLDELEKIAKNENDKELEKLVKQLDQKIEEMREPGVDVKEALAKLSEMQASIQAQQAQYNVGLVDAQMSALGEALASASAFEAAGNALQQQKYDKAASELEKAEPKLDRKESKALKEKLKKAAKDMKDAGLGELSEVTGELAESLDEESDCQGECKKLGKLAKAQARRKKISDLLTMQCQSLSECKSNCNKNSTAKFTLRKKSDSPSSNWGMSTSGNTDGEKTKLDSARKQENIQGQMGEGPSETETAHLPEGRQLATREYKEAYTKYKKLTEAALNSEPIPLGHRQTIRKYFELIRPDGDESEKAEPKASPNP